ARPVSVLAGPRRKRAEEEKERNEQREYQHCVARMAAPELARREQREDEQREVREDAEARREHEAPQAVDDAAARLYRFDVPLLIARQPGRAELDFVDPREQYDREAGRNDRPGEDRRSSRPWLVRGTRLEGVKDRHGDHRQEQRVGQTREEKRGC